MTKWFLGLALFGVTSASALAQGVPNAGVPVPAPGSYMPNYYNRQSQPLSPYLNMFRGSPGVNYYSGVRPGTTGAAGVFGAQVPFGYSQSRGGFIPAASNPEQEPVSVSADTTIPYIPSAAHPVVYGGGAMRSPGMSAASRPGFAGTQMPASAPKRPTR